MHRHFPLMVRFQPFTHAKDLYLIVAYARAFPGYISQVALTFWFNYPLVYGDKISVQLPGFLHTSNISLLAYNLPLAIQGNSSFRAVWLSQNATLELTCLVTIESGSRISVGVDGAAGLRSPFLGISSFINTPAYSVDATVLGPNPLHYMFSPSFDIGVSQAIASFEPFADGSVSIVFSFLFPEFLSINDSILIHLIGFTATQSSYFVTTYVDNPDLSLYWNGLTSSINITVVNHVLNRNQTVDLKNFIPLNYPPAGVSSETVLFSLSSVLNGVIIDAPFTNVTSICGFKYVSIHYTEKVPGASSGISLEFELGGSSLAPGDQVSFFLGSYSRFSSTAYAKVSSFLASFDNGNLTLQAMQNINVSTYNSVILSSNLGFIVPSSGIQPTDKVHAIILSRACRMAASVTFPYASLITSIHNASLSIFPRSASIGERVNITLGFNYSRNFSEGDVIVLRIPFLFRDIYLLHEVNLSSALPLFATYERYTGSVVMIFGSNFSLPSSTSYLTVDFLQNAGFSIPATGLPSSSSTISISSVYGSMDPVVLANPCVGVCSISANYSTDFTQTPLNIILIAVFSTSIYAGTKMSLELVGYQQGASGIGITVSNESFAAAVIFSYASGNSLSANFTMPIDVVSFTALTVSITDVTFSSTVMLTGPSLMIIDSILFPNQTVVLNFSPPSTVYSIPHVSNASLTLFNLMAGQTSRVSFGFVAIDGIDNSSHFRLRLPSYSIAATLSSPNSSVIAISLLISSPYIVMLDILLLSYVAPGSLWEIIIDGLITPYQGTSIGNSSLDASYSISVAPNVFAPFQPLPQSAVDAVYDVIVALGTNASFQLTSINFTLAVNFAVSAADSLNCTFPGLSGNQTFPLILDFVGTSASGTWIPGTSSIEIVFLNSTNATFLTFAVNAVNGANRISLPVRGFTGKSLGTVFFKRASRSVFISTTFLIPCFGVCSATCAVGIPKAGFPSDYSFTMTFGGRQLRYGDEIIFHLDGFTRNASSIIATSVPSISTIWNSTASALIVKPSFSFPPAFNVTFSISSDQSISLPTTGIRILNLFTVTWSANSGAVIYNDTTLIFSSVGFAEASNLIVAPRIAAAVGMYNFSLSFLDNLHPDDVILIGLIGATIPFGPIDRFVANRNITAVGIPASNTNFITIFHTSTLLLTVHETITARSAITFYVPNSAYVAIPYRGFNAFNAPELAVVSQYSPVTTTNFITFSIVGSFKPASFRASAQDIFLSFYVQCTLETRAQLIIYLPSVVGQDQLIAISTNLGVSAVSSGVYSSSTSSVVFTFLQKIPVNTVINMTLFASGLEFSNRIQYQNANDAAYSFLSTSCGCDQTAFDISDPNLLVNSSVSFSVPIINQNTNVTVGFTPVEDVLKGDIFFFEFPNFGNITGSSYPTLSLSDEAYLAFSVQSYLFGQNGTVYINVTTMITIPAGSTVSIVLISNSLFIPSAGVSVGSVYPLSWLRPSSVTGVQVIAIGQVNVVQRVASFISKSVIVTNPLPGVVSGIILSWQLTSVVSTGDTIVFRLPGFTYGGLSPQSVPVVGNLAPYVSCSWNPSSYTFIVKFLR